MIKLRTLFSATSHFIMNNVEKKQAIAKLFESLLTFFFEVFAKFRGQKKNRFRSSLGRPGYALEVESYALSEFQPPTMLGDHQNVDKTTRKNSICLGYRKSVPGL